MGILSIIGISVLAALVIAHHKLLDKAILASAKRHGMDTGQTNEHFFLGVCVCEYVKEIGCLLSKQREAMNTNVSHADACTIVLLLADARDPSSKWSG
jgi:hypothetical protein